MDESNVLEVLEGLLSIGTIKWPEHQAGSYSKYGRSASWRKFFEYNMMRYKQQHLKSDLDLRYLAELLSKQGGKCLITGTKLNHTVGDWSCCMISRIDQDRGFIKGNVVLLCRWINLIRDDKGWKELEASWVQLRKELVILLQ